MNSEYSGDNITPVQLFFLTFAYIFSGMFLRCGAYISGKDAWISALISAVFGILTVLIYYLSAKFYYSGNGGGSFAGWLKFAFGRVFGYIIALLYLLFFVFYSASGIYDFAEYLNLTSAPGISAYIFAFTLLAVCIFAVCRGLTVLGRFAEISVVFIIFALLIIFCGFLSVSDFSEYLPLFKTPREDLLYGTLNSVISPFCDSAVFLCIFGKVMSNRSSAASVYAQKDAEINDGIPGENLASSDTKKLPHRNSSPRKQLLNICFGAYLLAAVISALIFVIIVLRDEMLFGSELIVELSYPTVLAAELIPELNLRPVFDLCFSVLYILRISVMLYAVYLILSELFPRKKSKIPYLSLTSVFSLIGTLLFYTYFERKHLISEDPTASGVVFVRGSMHDNIFITVSLILLILIPCVLLLRSAFSSESLKKN